MPEKNKLSQLHDLYVSQAEMPSMDSGQIGHWVSLVVALEINKMPKKVMSDAIKILTNIGWNEFAQLVELAINSEILRIHQVVGRKIS